MHLVRREFHYSIPGWHRDIVPQTQLWHLSVPLHIPHVREDFPRWLSSKESACNSGDMGLMPGLGRSPREGNDYPLQYSCLGKHMDRGTWQATVHGVARVRHDLATECALVWEKWKLGRTIGRSQLYCFLSWELPACKRAFFTFPLGPKSLSRKALSCSRTGGTMQIGISTSEIQFISPLDSLTNLCLHSCSMSNRGDIFISITCAGFFLKLFRIQAGRKKFLFIWLSWIPTHRTISDLL